ncbi:MAG: tetratricopeptide repeat protein [Vampirovibrio sp.]|nr:tetratricopeptide repeat protein [Vampirovibrio sp.]
MISLACLFTQSVGFAGEPKVIKATASISELDDALKNATARTKQHKLYVSRQPAIRRADALVDAYKLGGAESIYRQILAKDPKNPGAHHGLGKVYYYRTTASNQLIREQRDSYYERSTQEHLTALRYEPGYVDAWLDLGTVYLEQQRTAEALEAFAMAYTLAPKNSEANEAIGRILFERRELNAAISYYQKAITYDSKNASAHFYLGKAYTDRREFNPAIDALQTSLHLYPNSAPVAFELGRVYSLQGNRAAAVTHFQKAIDIKPEYIPARQQLADYHEQRGNLAQALEHLKILADLQPGQFELQYRLADLAIRNHQPELAKARFEKILALSPGSPRALAGLSTLSAQKAKEYRQSGDIMDMASAYAEAEQSLEYYPDNLSAKLTQVKLEGSPDHLNTSTENELQATLQTPPAGLNQLIKQGEVLAARFDLAGAQQAFHRAIYSVNGLEDMVNLGEVLLNLGQTDLANQLFQRLHLLHGNSPAARHAARFGISKVYEQKQTALSLTVQAQGFGKKQDHQAVKTALEALKKDQQQADAHLLLGKLYERQKKYTKAIRHYHAYLALAPHDPNAEKIRKRITKLARY